MSDPTEPLDPTAAPEVHLDISAFLPDDVEVWDGVGPEPEVPEWARDLPDEPVAAPEPRAASTEPVADAAAAAEPDASGSAPPDDVDLAALGRLEDELAAVDDALLALDAGDPSRSPLLTELLDR